MKFDIVIVGAGITACVLAEQLAKQGRSILIIEQRNHIGGNCYDFRNDNNLLIHKYGPHIFHTNKEEVWQYLSNFTDWEPYTHRVLADVEGKLVPIPFNLNSLRECFPTSLANQLETKLLERFGYGKKVSILDLRKEVDEDLQFLSNYIYEKVFVGYTTKQWDVSPTDLDPSVTGRVPVFISRDNRYFQDKYQSLPRLGYTEMFKNMLDHKNIHILLATNYFDIHQQLQYEKMIFTGKIDTFFDCKFGALPYRDLRFEFIDYNLEHFQEVAQVNYPCNHDYTRITDFSRFYNRTKHFGTSIAKEFSCEHNPLENLSPYYPVPNEESEIIFQKYLYEAKNNENIIFAGRLGNYKYYNMDDAVSKALELVKRI